MVKVFRDYVLLFWFQLLSLLFFLLCLLWRGLYTVWERNMWVTQNKMLCISFGLFLKIFALTLYLFILRLILSVIMSPATTLCKETQITYPIICGWICIFVYLCSVFLFPSVIRLFLICTVVLFFYTKKLFVACMYWLTAKTQWNKETLRKEAYGHDLCTICQCNTTYKYQIELLLVTSSFYTCWSKYFPLEKGS